MKSFSLRSQKAIETPMSTQSKKKFNVGYSFLLAQPFAIAGVGMSVLTISTSNRSS